MQTAEAVEAGLKDDRSGSKWSGSRLYTEWPVIDIWHLIRSLTHAISITLIACLHDPANVQQMYSKYTWIAGRLLDVCWKFAGSCKHPIGWSVLVTLSVLPADLPGIHPKLIPTSHPAFSVFVLKMEIIKMQRFDKNDNICNTNRPG